MNFQSVYIVFTGMERKLGNKTHDGAIRGGQHHILRAVGRLQGGARIHRRVHIPLDALQGRQPDPGRGVVPQTHGRVDVRQKIQNFEKTLGLRNL